MLKKDKKTLENICFFLIFTITYCSMPSASLGSSTTYKRHQTLLKLCHPSEVEEEEHISLAFHQG